MRACCFKAALGVLLLVPATAFAATSLQWAGPYVGIDAGMNRSGSSGFSSENSFTAGVNAGWNIVVGPLWGTYFVIGGSAFYRWNGERDHGTCGNGAACTDIDMGSDVYGVDVLVGFPVGAGGNFMPYFGSGYRHIRLTGDVSGSDHTWVNDFDLGLRWGLSRTIKLDFRYSYAEYGGEVDDWRNNNFTVGVNFHF